MLNIETLTLTKIIGSENIEKLLNEALSDRGDSQKKNGTAQF